MIPAELLADAYRDDLRDARDATVAAVEVYADAGPPLLATLTAVGIAAQVDLAEQYLTAVLTVTRQEPVIALGLLPSDYVDVLHLERAYAVALESYADALPSLRRIGAAETADAGRRALADGMTRRRVGWTRRTGSNPCELCRALANGGVLAASTPMASHPHCSCVAQIVDREDRG